MTDAVCPSCGHANPAEARFCRSCRAYLGAPRTAAGDAAAPTTTVAGRGAPAADDVRAVRDVRIEPGGGETAEGASAEAGADAIRPMPPGEVTSVHSAVRIEEPPEPEPEAELGPGERKCPSCGRANPEARRFCQHCGAALQDLTPTAAGTDPSAPAADADRSFGAFVGRTMHRGEFAYDRSVALKTRIVRILGILVVFGIGASMLPPWGSSVRDSVGSFVSDHMPKSYTDVNGDVRAVATDPPTPPRAGYEPQLAVDGRKETTWIVPWSNDAPLKSTSAVCAEDPSTSVALVVSFDKPLTIDQLVVKGLPEANEASWLFPPSEIDLCTPDHTRRIALDEALMRSAQTKTVSLGWSGVDRLSVYVVNVYDRRQANEAQYPKSASLAELTFRQQS